MLTRPYALILTTVQSTATFGVFVARISPADIAPIVTLARAALEDAVALDRLLATTAKASEHSPFEIS